MTGLPDKSAESLSIAPRLSNRSGTEEVSTAREFPAGALIGYIGAVLFVLSPGKYDLLAGLISIAAFIIVQLTSPKCRINIAIPLCPSNVAQLLFCLQLVVIPVLMTFHGPVLETLPRLPSVNAINLSLIIDTIAYIAFSVAYQWCYMKRANTIPPANEHQQKGTLSDQKTMPWLIAGYAFIGIAGFWFYYGGLTGYIEYLSSPSYQVVLSQAQDATLVGTAGTFLRPFLAFSIVLAWSVWIENNRYKVSWQQCGLITLLVLILLVPLNFNYNRGTMVGPIVAIVATYSLRVHRFSFKLLSAAGAILLSVLIFFGNYRSTDVLVSDLTDSSVSSSLVVDSDTAINFVQVYGSAPQFTAFLLEETDFGSRLYWGQTLVSSLVYPVPILGKPFRDTSGVAIFNMLIYDDPTIIDQVIPFVGEVFMNFHLPGVIVCYFLFGCVVAALQRRFIRADTIFKTYAWFFLSIWTLFLIVGSLAVVTQMYVYFLWPIYLYALVTMIVTHSERGKQKRISHNEC